MMKIGRLYTSRIPSPHREMTGDNANKLNSKVPSPHGGGLGWGQCKSEDLEVEKME